MSKKIPLYALILTVIIAIVITFNASFLFFEQKYNKRLNDTLSGYSFFEKLSDVDKTVKENYIGKIDDEELESAVIRGYLTGIGDKYSLYMTSSEYEDYMKELGGSAVGIGVNVIYSADENTIEVIRVLPDSPASEAGILEGDIISGVEGKLVSDIGYYSALDLIQGEEGTEVNITVTRGDDEIKLTCTRREVKMFSVSYHVFGGSGDIGVVQISEFNSTTPEQFKSAVEVLQASGCSRFVFDLRNNGGGSLDSIVEVLDYILPKGPIAHIYYNSGESETFESDENCLNASIAVLTNKKTASAAELFTAALKDYSDKDLLNAVLVGTTTYGKGVFQSHFKLKDGSVIKITAGKYDPPYSENYDGKGIAPDVEVELSEEASKMNFYKLTDQNDNQLIAAVGELEKLK